MDSFLETHFLKTGMENFLQPPISPKTKRLLSCHCFTWINKEEVKIELNEGILSVSGEKKFQKRRK